MAGEEDLTRGHKCLTQDCPGNAWSVIRTENVTGGIRRVRRCMRCKGIIVTFERAYFSDAKNPPIPLTAYFQRR